VQIEDGYLRMVASVLFRLHTRPERWFGKTERWLLPNKMGIRAHDWMPAQTSIGEQP